MEKITKTLTNNLFNIIMLVVLIVVAIILLPQPTSNFKYHFELGKPWGYDLLMAEEDFPIYKTDAQLQADKDELRGQFTPYYTILSQTTDKKLNELNETIEAERLNKKTTEYLQQQMTAIYKRGILNADDVNQLKKDGYKSITILNEQHVATQQKVANLYTPKTAYTYLLDNAPTNAIENRLREFDLNNYLVPTLAYDAETSETVYNTLMQSVSLTQGMVQTGEKIIDRGEIVNERAYQILSSLKQAYREKGTSVEQQRWTWAGRIMLIIILFGMLSMYLVSFRPHLLQQKRNVIFITTMIILLLAITSALVRFTTISIWIIPFAWVAILVRVFFDSRTGFLVHLTTILLCSLMVTNPSEFIVIQVVIAIVAVSSLKDMSERSTLAQTAGWIFLAYVLTFTAFSLMQTGDYKQVEAWQYLFFLANAILVLLVYGLVFLFEKLFGFVSATTLVELTNVNTKLLMQLAEKAPGTFQHSLQVSNLATEAAKAINANALLVRAGALYHDIGKMQHPEYFTENQSNGDNPLTKMSLTDAAQTVIRHVTDGVQLARQNKLPDAIVNFILTHHGTSKTRYFYNSYVNQHPDEAVDETLFTYPGPAPQTKETALLMMADAVEARSRSLQIYNEQTIGDMVEQMIGAQVTDKQFANAPLSFRDVEVIKAVFKEKILQMNHHRISYPELKK